MKKQLKTLFIAIELIIAITCAAYLKGPLRVQAQGTPMITFEPSFYQAKKLGETFNVTVKLYNVETTDKMEGVQFRVQYNASILEAVSVTEGPFLQQFNNTLEPPYTYFISHIEDDVFLYGPSVVVGILLLPSATGVWTNFPEGNGTLATITFKAISQLWQPLSWKMPLNETMLVNDDGEEIPHTLIHGLYEIQAQPPSITYQPSKPSAGEVVVFNATEYRYLDHDITYSWDFGDGAILNVTEPTTHHVYALPGDYSVTLVCIMNSLSSNVTTTEISVVFYKSLEIKIDVGSPHFRGEIIEFSVLITHFGKTVNATKIEAILYYNGVVYADLSASVQYVDTGFYRIPYNILADAETGTYTLIIKAEYYEVEGTDIKSFQINPTLTSWGDSIAQITEIENGIATIITNLDSIKVNLTAINATLTGIDGDIATISTTLGDVDVKLGDTQSIATTTLYATSVLSAITVILAAAILIFIRKK